jgi:hypothetical protein
MRTVRAITRLREQLTLQVGLLDTDYVALFTRIMAVKKMCGKTGTLWWFVISTNVVG